MPIRALHRAPCRVHPRAFTLIEVLVVVAIIALLISILLPSLKKARDQAKMIVCTDHQKELASGTYYYSLDNRNRLPDRITWVYVGKPNAQNVLPYPGPWSGDLMGHQRVPGVRPLRKPYIQQAELFMCPMDDGSRAPGTGGFPPIQPATFSYTRNDYIVSAMVSANKWGGGQYFPWDKPKYPSKTPVYVEEMTVGPEALSPINDGYMTVSTYDRLTLRHSNRAVLSYHDLHAEAVDAQTYNRTPTHGPNAGYQHYIMAPGIPWQP